MYFGKRNLISDQKLEKKQITGDYLSHKKEYIADRNVEKARDAIKGIS